MSGMHILDHSHQLFDSKTSRRESVVFGVEARRRFDRGVVKAATTVDSDNANLPRTLERLALSRSA